MLTDRRQQQAIIDLRHGLLTLLAAWLARALAWQMPLANFYPIQRPPRTECVKKLNDSYIILKRNPVKLQIT